MKIRTFGYVVIWVVAVVVVCLFVVKTVNASEDVAGDFSLTEKNRSRFDSGYVPFDGFSTEVKC